MRMDGRCWDDEIVADLFNNRDQHCIKKITLTDEVSEDSLYWCKENSGEYSVRSAYRMLQVQKGRWQAIDNDSLWRRVWQIKAPPKVLNMIWRALAQCLPTLNALHEKHVPVNRMCPVCNGEEETTRHALIKCPFAAQCWRDKGLLWVDTRIEVFAEWLDKVLGISRRDEYAEIVTLCWSIWKAKNNIFWNKVRSSVYGVVNSTKQYLSDWTKAQKISTKALFQFVEEGDGACNWVKPQKDIVKIYVDEATFTKSSSYGVGMLARDWEGKVILHYNKSGQL